MIISVLSVVVPFFRLASVTHAEEATNATHVDCTTGKCDQLEDSLNTACLKPNAS